ncbi:MAG: hypothetical protein P1V81_13520 [Planctomycetota bacterium]|nr:hypothetical protein [Planctomycetota bacterium]
MARSSLRLALLAQVVLALFLPGASAGTITVGPTGTGAQFDDLAAAVSAASAGDVILVAAGKYVGGSTLVIDKSLTILGEGSANTRYEVSAGDIFSVQLPLHVIQLDPTEEVRIVGLELSAHSSAFGGKAAAAVLVSGCKGPVVLADVISGGLVDISAPAVVEVWDSDQVVFDGCAFGASVGQAGSPPAAMIVVNSSVYLNSCALAGSSAPESVVPVLAYDGAVGIHATDSELRLSRTVVLGGAGMFEAPFSSPPSLTSGGAAVVGWGSTDVLVRGGPGNLLLGGVGGHKYIGVGSQYGPGGAAVLLDAGSRLASVSDAALVAGTTLHGAASTPAVDGTGVWSQVAEPLATLGSSTRLVAPGSSVTLELASAPGATVVVLIAADQVPAFSLPGFHGEVLLDPFAYSVLAVTTLDAAGLGLHTGTVPAIASLVGGSVLAQTLAINPSADLSFSAPVLVAVR